jgi:hypothetical protein
MALGIFKPHEDPGNVLSLPQAKVWTNLHSELRFAQTIDRALFTQTRQLLNETWMVQGNK